jgi:hypothetical protein
LARAEAPGAALCNALQQGLSDCTTEAKADPKCPQARASVEAAYKAAQGAIDSTQQPQAEKAVGLWQALADDIVPAPGTSVDDWTKTAQDFGEACYRLGHPGN